MSIHCDCPKREPHMQPEEYRALLQDNERLAGALEDLLHDTQHDYHNCGDEDCPVRKAEAALAAHRGRG